MARPRYTDYLQTGNFHVLDMSFTIPPVLLPVYGFKSCTLPSLSLDIHKITEGNYEYPRKMVKGASVTPCVLEQGVSISNSDFYDWVRKAVVGRIAPKNLLIVQFARLTKAENFMFTSNQVPPGIEYVKSVPGRAWLLKKCRPLMYKPGSDLDAMSQEVSIAQLEIEFEEFQEFNLGV